MKIYWVITNTGDYGGMTDYYVLARSPEEAILIAFNYDKEAIRKWKIDLYDISVREITWEKYLKHSMNLHLPEGWKFQFDGYGAIDIMGEED